MSTTLRLGESKSGPVKLDLEQLIETRLLITATSGGGKSGAVYTLCEQAIAHVQIIALDPEGEMSPLRAKYPFILAGPDGETPASVKTASLLAHRLLKLGVSAICDLYEMPNLQRHEFVRDFLMAMVDAPKDLWHPVIVIIDEAHLFAPENGQGSSVAAGAVEALATRGRKRGFVPVLITQRLAMLDKTVASMCQNVLIGRTSPIDQNRAADQLHISGKVAREDFKRQIARMQTGAFFAYGMAFNVDEPTSFQVDRAATLPEKKDRMSLQMTIPTPDSIKALLPQLTDLPREADERTQTVEDLTKALTEARKKILEYEKSPKAKDEETERMLREQLTEIGNHVGTLEGLCNTQTDKINQARVLVEKLFQVLGPNQSAAVLTNAIVPLKPTPLKIPDAPTTVSSDVSMPVGERKTLVLLAQYREGLKRTQITVLAEFAKSTCNAYLQRLQAKQFVDATSDVVTITNEGLVALGSYERLPTGEALQESWISKLPKGEANTLKLLCERRDGMTRDEFIEISGFAKSTANAYLQRLAGKMLIEVSGRTIKASPTLFD